MAWRKEIEAKNILVLRKTDLKTENRRLAANLSMPHEQFCREINLNRSYNF